MTAHDDVKADLASHPGLTRPQMEQLVKLLKRKPGGGGVAVTVALRSMLPAAGRRLTSVSAIERAEYLRVLEGIIDLTVRRVAR